MSQYYRDMKKWGKRAYEKKKLKKVQAIVGPIVVFIVFLLVVFCGKTIIKDWKAGTGIRAKNRIRRRLDKENVRILREEEERKLTEEVMREMNDEKGNQ